MDEHDIEPDDFLDFVHDIDHVAARCRTGRSAHAIETLPGRKLILTNGSRQHAENVAGEARHPRPFRGDLRHRGGRLRAQARGADL